MCIVLFLIIEDTEWTVTDEVGREEGSVYSEIVRKYERSRYNRALCLKYYGFMCRGCGDKLEEKYGPVGTNVIHVHHIVPVSLMHGAYQLNPIKDLIPLCPNCHNIVHRKNPPMSIKELNLLTKLEINSGTVNLPNLRSLVSNWSVVNISTSSFIKGIHSSKWLFTKDFIPDDQPSPPMMIQPFL